MWKLKTIEAENLLSLIHISTKGDVLIPRLTVFHDGAVPESEIYDAIEEQLNAYMMEIDFRCV